MLPLFCVRIKPLGRAVSWFGHPVREPGAIYGRRDAGEQSAADSRFGRLERDGSGMADDPCSDPDEAGPQAGRPSPPADRRPAGRHRDCRPSMKLKPHLVPRHALAGKTRPIDRLPAFLDMPFGGDALVVEPNDPVRFHRQLGDGEADLREQVTPMPFDPGDNPP